MNEVPSNNGVQAPVFRAALVVDAGEAGWRSAAELGDFVDRPAGEEDRDWRALDPRRDDGDGAEDEE